MKQKMLVISDVWSDSKTDWADSYESCFGSDYEVEYLNSDNLAGIDSSGKTQEELHLAFVSEGISRAVKRLIFLQLQVDVVLGLSIGGAIAWRAALSGLQYQKLVCVSATRLRYEKVKPSMEVDLIYGELDHFRPQATWADKLDLELSVIPGKGHDLYLDPKLIKRTAFRK